MILDLAEDGKFIVISAFKVRQDTDPSAVLKELRAAVPDLEVQFFEGEHTAGKDHLELAAIDAFQAFKTGINISRSIAMETLLYASAQRQIEVAIRTLGVTRNSRTVYLVAFSHTRNEAELLEDSIARLAETDLDDSLLDDWSENKASEIMRIYGITSVELDAIRMPCKGTKEAITRAVIERVALLSTRT